jgi:hypothetical protein
MTRAWAQSQKLFPGEKAIVIPTCPVIVTQLPVSPHQTSSFHRPTTNRKGRKSFSGARQKQDFRVNNLNSSNFIETRLDLAIIKRNKVLGVVFFLREREEKTGTNNLTHLSSYLADNGSSLFPIILLHHHQVFAFWATTRRRKRIHVRD